MALTAHEHRQVQDATKSARAAQSRARRASGGPTYRKVPIVVSLLETMDAEGVPLLLATSDAPNERGRYFALRFERGRWTCRCASFQALGGCPHVGHVQATEHEVPDA